MGEVILDVRTPEEAALGRISEKGLEIDFYGDNFNEKLNELDKNHTYLMYCRSGGRSGKTMKIMGEQGFKNVNNLKGRYTAWSKHKQD